MSKSLQISLFLLSFFTLTYLNHYNFIFGNFFFYHDSSNIAAEFHAFYDSLFQGNLPLWNPYLNAGTPLFLGTEAFSVMDPIALLSFAIAKGAGKSGMIAFQLASYFWLLLFSIGGALLSRRIIKNSWVQAIVFLILYAGSIPAMNREQAPGLFIPFRYAPFLMLSLFTFFEKPSLFSSLVLAIAVTFNAGGFQTGYLAAFAICFILLYFILFKVSLKKHIKYIPNIFLISLLGISPVIVSGFMMLDSVAIPRLFSQSHFIFPLERFLRGLVDFIPFQHAKHGHSFIGSVPGICFLLSLLKFRSSTQEEKLWICLFFFSCIFTMGGLDPLFNTQGTFLGLRNWGFLFSLVLLCMSQLAAIGLKYFLENKITKTNCVFLSFIVGLLIWYYQPAIHHPVLLRFLLAVLLPIIFIIIISKRNPRFALICTFSMLSLELFNFSAQEVYSIQSNKNTVLLTYPFHSTSRYYNNRPWSLNLLKLVPFHYNAPIVHQLPAAFLPASVTGQYGSSKEADDGDPLTHPFRTKEYHLLVSSQIPEAVLLKTLGVKDPIISFKSDALRFSTNKSVIEYLKAIDPNELDSKVLVVGDSPVTNYTNPLFSPRWSLINYDQNKIKIKSETSTSSYLVYSDGYTKDWKAKIDGKAAPVFLANGGVKAVLVPEGTHVVEFYYEPVLYIFCFWLRLSVEGVGILLILRKFVKLLLEVKFRLQSGKHLVLRYS